MKTGILMLLTAAASEAAAATGAAAVAVVIELTSPKLTELAAAKIAAGKKLGALMAAGDLDSKEYTEAALELAGIQSEVKAEKARLAKEASDAKLAELRKAEVAELDNFLALRDKAAAKTATDDDKAAATNAYEGIVNKLLKFVAPKPSATGGAKSSGGSKSERILQMMIAGNTYDQMIAEGLGDGTIRTVAGNEKYKKNADGTYTKKA